MKNLNNKNIIIFGGSTGIGREMAKLSSMAGANVIIASRNIKNLESAQSIINKEIEKEVTIKVCDISKDDDVKSIYEYGESLVGGIYGIICCSGVYGPIGPFQENSFEDWKKCIDINLIGTARCIYLIAN